MTKAILDFVNRSMDEQVARKAVPPGFPDLPVIPASRYVARDFADLEMRHIWDKKWLFVGVESDLPEAGSYFLFERLGRSIIISRGRDGVIRAFHNICRHRGSALLTEPSGKVKRFVCPYHTWGYELTGELTSVPLAHDFPCLDKAKRSLAAVKCEVFRDLIFINLDAEAPALAENLEPMLPHLEGFPLEGLVTRDVYSIDLDCNWKVALHNFLEIYHVNSVHPVTLAPYFDTPSYFITLLDKGHSRLATRKKKGPSLFESGAPAPEGTGEIFSELSIAPVIFPNIFIPLDPSGFMPLTIWPVSVDKSVLEVRTFGWKSGSPDRAYWETIRDRGLDIVREDIHLFDTLQRGLASRVIDGMKLGYQERALYWFEEEVDRSIGVADIPENMRVSQVLTDHVKEIAREEARASQVPLTEVG